MNNDQDEKRILEKRKAIADQLKALTDKKPKSEVKIDASGKFRLGGKFISKENYDLYQANWQKSVDSWKEKYNDLVKKDSDLYNKLSKASSDNLRERPSKKTSPDPQEKKTKPTSHINSFLNESEPIIEQWRNEAIDGFKLSDIIGQKGEKYARISLDLKIIAGKIADTADKSLAMLTALIKNTDKIDQIRGAFSNNISKVEILVDRKRMAVQKSIRIDELIEKEDQKKISENERVEESFDPREQLNQKILDLEERRLEIKRKMAERRHDKLSKKGLERGLGVLGKVAMSPLGLLDFVGIDTSDERKLLGALFKPVGFAAKGLSYGVKSLFSPTDKSLRKENNEVSNEMGLARLEKKRAISESASQKKSEPRREVQSIDVLGGTKKSLVGMFQKQPSEKNSSQTNSNLTNSSVRNYNTYDKSSFEQSGIGSNPKSFGDTLDLNRSDDDAILNEQKTTNVILTDISGELKKGLGQTKSASSGGGIGGIIGGIGGMLTKGLGALFGTLVGTLGGKILGALATAATSVIPMVLANPIAGAAIAAAAAAVPVAILGKAGWDAFKSWMSAKETTDGVAESGKSSVIARLKDAGASDKEIKQYGDLYQEEVNIRTNAYGEPELLARNRKSRNLSQRNAILGKYKLYSPSVNNNYNVSNGNVSQVNNGTDSMSVIQDSVMRATDYKPPSQIQEKNADPADLWQDLKNFLDGDFIDKLSDSIADSLSKKKGPSKGLMPSLGGF